MDCESEVKDDVPPTSPGQGNPPKHRNPQRGPRRYRRNRGKVPRRHTSHPHTRRGRKTPWKPTRAIELSLHPRPFDESHTERVYLLNALQMRDREALDLFRQLADVEEHINHLRHQRQQDNERRKVNSKVKVRVDGVPVNEIRDQEREEEEEAQGKARTLQNARRQRRWLRKQTKRAVNAECEILMRLGEVYVEIQCRERWRQVGQERAAFERGHNPTGFELPPPQQSYWHLNPDWTLLYPNIYPNMYPYQPYPGIYAGCGGYPPSSPYPVVLERGFGGYEYYDRDPTLPAQTNGSTEARGNGNNDVRRSESYQVDGGEHTRLLMMHTMNTYTNLRRGGDKVIRRKQRKGR
ncbi:hypothetical protein GQX73_g2459 [Xylaria multiplex]|uniref:Uncharacterized protein n=1 Tax=Xylaria multiplex TaxID=323545 RepID=A0A7C8IU97_9PEZI|nr:hypothetical protein GQX73_g2459 [Xylaria multiplex]